VGLADGCEFQIFFRKQEDIVLVLSLKILIVSARWSAVVKEIWSGNPHGFSCGAVVKLKNQPDQVKVPILFSVNGW
jgi:hypothetical protein